MPTWNQPEHHDQDHDAADVERTFGWSCGRTAGTLAGRSEPAARATSWLSGRASLGGLRRGHRLQLGWRGLAPRCAGDPGTETQLRTVPPGGNVSGVIWRTPREPGRGSRNALWSTSRYDGLRGEGSIPVPLPPPASLTPLFLRAVSIAKGPISVAISNSISGPPTSRVAVLFSERPVSLRTSGLC